METKTIEELITSRREVAGKIDILKKDLSAIDDQITELALPVMSDKLRATNKDYGSLKLDVGGEAIQGEIRKTIKWDSDALKEIASKIPAEDSALIFTVSLSISEEQFATLEECEHPALGEILLARTVSYSAFSAKPVKAKG